MGHYQRSNLSSGQTWQVLFAETVSNVSLGYTWTVAAGSSTVSISVSIDNGSTWYDIASLISGVGSFPSGLISVPTSAKFNAVEFVFVPDANGNTVTLELLG